MLQPLIQCQFVGSRRTQEDLCLVKSSKDFHVMRSRDRLDGTLFYPLFYRETTASKKSSKQEVATSLLYQAC